MLVVGAGFAGLAAARELQQSVAAEVVVLEAGQRVGGRAETRRVGDLSLELGATWLHGLGAPDAPNPVLAECQAHCLLPATPDGEPATNSEGASTHVCRFMSWLAH